MYSICYYIQKSMYLCVDVLYLCVDVRTVFQFTEHVQLSCSVMYCRSHATQHLLCCLKMCIICV